MLSDVVRYVVNDYEPTIFIVYKDGEFWATSTTEDYSYVVLPLEKTALARKEAT